MKMTGGGAYEQKKTRAGHEFFRFLIEGDIFVSALECKVICVDIYFCAVID